MNWQEQADATEDRLRLQFVAAQQGDSGVYRQFLKALAPHLRAYFRKRLSRYPDDVEDLVQETMLAIHTHRHTYRADRPLTAWIHTIARYKLVDVLRARSRRDDLNDPLDDEQQLFAQSDTDAADARRDLARLLATLPERQRRALLMTKVDGASVAEAAQALGMSEVAVKVGVHRTLKTLAARVKGGA